ncbi:aldehyde dehydrogenase family protein [Sphingobium sp.]|uniref:aldehyde dehydrogenase family protein n=1 Tax=Sphingobium sp. TaxID=1912891 RepID=UPI003B3A168C
MAWTKNGNLASDIYDNPRMLLIGGQWVACSTGQTIPVLDPSTGRQVATLQRGGAEDVDMAVAAARKAFETGPWRQCNGVMREQMMRRLADIMEAHCDELALLEAIDGGKPIAVARQVDVLGNIARLRYAAGWAPRLIGDSFEPAINAPMHCFSTREAIGVAGLIVPWNFPLGMAISKMADALAAGCTMVLKPSELTSLATLRMGELIGQAGFPDGVVNIVTGFGAEAGQALADHRDVDKLSFTGSTAVGKRLLQAATGNLKRLTLELGGKSPAIVFADADSDVSVRGVLRNFTYNSGQICAAGSRVFVHRSIYDSFTDRLAKAADGIRVGPATATGTEMGPLISRSQQDRVNGYIAGGVADGAQIVTGGGHAAQDGGYFIRPTILANSRANMAIRKEEIFGPVATISPFDDDDLVAIAAEANDTEYGLSAFIYTRNLSKAHQMARLIRAGTVRVNGAGLDYTMPFGGYKQSGWGRENGQEGVLSFTELKTVMMAL